jgi:hypothetical protein
MTPKTVPSSVNLEKLKDLDSCTVSNAIGRLNVRLRNEGFLSGVARCRFPKLPPMVGYAATARIRTASPPMSHRCYYDRMDWCNYVASLMQAGTRSSTQAMALVKLSQDDLYRPVSVNVPSLSRTFPGKLARFSADVREETRRMHTEVDVENPSRVLLPGLYAEVTINTAVDIVDSSGKIERRQIVIGIQTATDAEVLSGLQEGETVVVSDRSGLKPSQPVQAKSIPLIQYQGSEEQD